MRKLALTSLFLAFLFPSLALADDAKGDIVSIDETANTLTLNDGNTYKLPGEFDYSVLKIGMKILVFYDKQDGTRYVSEIEPQGN